MRKDNSISLCGVGFHCIQIAFQLTSHSKTVIVYFLLMISYYIFCTVFYSILYSFRVEEHHCGSAAAGSFRKGFRQLLSMFSINKILNSSTFYVFVQTIQTHGKYNVMALGSLESSTLITFEDNLISDRRDPVTLCDLKMVLDLLGLSTEHKVGCRPPGILVAVRDQTKELKIEGEDTLPRLITSSPC